MELHAWLQRVLFYLLIKCMLRKTGQGNKEEILPRYWTVTYYLPPFLHVIIKQKGIE